MSVTGHKSVSSLAVYQRVCDSEKLAIGQSIAMHVNQAVLPAPLILPALLAPQSSTCTAIVPAFDKCDDEALHVKQISLPPVPVTQVLSAPHSSSDLGRIVEKSDDEVLALQPYLSDIICDYIDLPETNTQKVLQSLQATGIFSYCPSRQTGTHITAQTPLDPAMQNLSLTENIEMNIYREEPRNAPISPPSPRNTEQEERHILPVNLNEISNFKDDASKDWTDEPPPSYSSLFV
ncbi:uncharacterized protein LOC134274210 [Saccostrea cucullata]|uniref:uncharacterized protein LOC134274210 n=1 Tax=Saccostrea cuccullata TaxID=36930 RepID=UPI002ED11DB6